MKKLFILLCFSAICILSAKEVIYVPGWLTQKEHQSFNAEKQLLEKTFPGYKIKVMPWDSFRKWADARSRSEDFATDVAEYITSIPADQQREVILIGHSLGGRCVTYTAHHLKEKNIKVNRIILLGSAINNDDPHLNFIGEVSLQPALNVYSYSDNALKLYAKSEGSCAAGQMGISKPHSNIREFRLRKTYTFKISKNQQEMQRALNHFAQLYLRELSGFLSKTVPDKKIDHNAVWQAVDGDRKQVKKELPLIIPETDSYYGWSYINLKDSFEKPVHVLGKKVNSIRISVDMHFVIDPYGRIMKIESLARWHKIKKLLDAQLTN